MERAASRSGACPDAPLVQPPPRLFCLPPSVALRWQTGARTCRWSMEPGSARARVAARSSRPRMLATRSVPKSRPIGWSGIDSSPAPRPRPSRNRRQERACPRGARRRPGRPGLSPGPLPRPGRGMLPRRRRRPAPATGSRPGVADSTPPATSRTLGGRSTWASPTGWTASWSTTGPTAARPHARGDSRSSCPAPRKRGSSPRSTSTTARHSTASRRTGRWWSTSGARTWWLGSCAWPCPGVVPSPWMKSRSTRPRTPRRTWPCTSRPIRRASCRASMPGRRSRRSRRPRLPLRRRSSCWTTRAKWWIRHAIWRTVCAPGPSRRDWAL